MIFSNLFHKSNKQESKVVTLPLHDMSTAPISELEEDKREEVQNKDGANSQPLTVTYVTSWPIDIIYGYLRKDYSSQGFSDAMVNSDISFKDINLRIIKNRILMTFREVNLKYDALDRYLDTKIQKCAQAGLISTVAELEQQKSIIETHKSELRLLEDNFSNGSHDATICLQSYECGFLRGIATIMLGNTSTPSAREMGMQTIINNSKNETA